MAESMSDILSDEPPAPPEKQEAQEQSQEAAAPAEKPQYQSRKQAHQEKEFGAQGLVRDPETGQFAKKAAEPDAAPQEQKPDAGATTVAAQPAPVVAAPVAASQQEQMTPKELAFLKAAQDERNKRQELERRIAAMEAQKPAEPAKTFWDDPEAALAKQKQDMDGIVIQTRMATAEAIARSKHPDFDEKVAAFQTVLQQAPGVYQQWLSSPDPAEFAFSLGKNHLELQAVGSIDGLRAQIQKDTEARVRAQVEAELKAKYEKAAADRAALPGSLSDARGANVSRPVWNGPTSFADILK